ncbi:MAG: pyruvate kinase [Sulfuricurvum sp.]
MKKKTKIVATIGPASDNFETILSLIRSGVNVLRLNFSHGTHEYHSKVLAEIHRAIDESGLNIGILQDISGPKIRLGELESNLDLAKGDIIEFLKEDVVGKQVGEGVFRVSINQPTILDELNMGDAIYLYDGIIKTKVIEIFAGGVKVLVENSGTISSKKGVNFPNTRLNIDIITQKDREDMIWGIKNGVDFMAISFVQNANDMLKAREILYEHKADVELIAKIEKFDAIENIDEIIKNSDAIMIARGDLGIEVPFYEVPLLQKMLIDKANAASKPVITATQMLLSMTKNRSATRAEISDVANAVLDGTDAVMLSEESAIGHNPTLAVKTMVQTIQAVEKIYPFNKFDNFSVDDITDSVDRAALRLASDADARGIIAITSSGGSVKKLSRYRPKRDIYAVVHSKKVARYLTLCWGVVPAFYIQKAPLDRMIASVMKDGLGRDILKLNSRYILTAGDPAGVKGSVNMIRLLRAHEMEFYKNLEE